jgi:flagellar hook-length control protein FliK
MPSTTTTSVTIGTILDLIGPTTASTGSSKDCSVFDALLQPTPVPVSKPAAEQPPVAAAQPRREERPDDAGGYQSERPASTPAADSAGDQQPQTPQRPEGKEQTEAALKPAAEPEVADDQDQAAAELIVESLAGLSVAASALPLADQTPEAAGEASESPEAINPRSNRQKGRPPADRLATSETTDLAAAVNGTVAPAKTDQATGTEAARRIDVPVAESAKTSDAQPADKTADDSQSALELAQATETGTDLSSSLPTASEIVPLQTDAKRDEKTAASSSEVTEPSKSLDGATSSVATTDTAGQRANSAPVVAVAPPQAVGNSDGGRSTNSSTQQGIGSVGASSPRSRLPAEILNQTAGHTVRRGGVEFDATRVLNRVARAFAAAQDRDGELHLRLSPPELGAMKLEIRIQDGAMVAHMHTETEAARTAIIENLPALRERLNEQGVRIERFDVDLMQRQAGGSPDQPGQRQHEPTPPPEVRVRSQSAAPVQTASLASSTLAATAAASGLNVII